jgi:hypothetical protein
LRQQVLAILSDRTCIIEIQLWKSPIKLPLSSLRDTRQAPTRHQEHTMDVALLPLEQLIPLCAQPAPQRNAIATAPLAEFGWRKPIVVDEEMVILAGHTRLEAARRLGPATAPVHVAGPDAGTGASLPADGQPGARGRRVPYGETRGNPAPSTTPSRAPARQEFGGAR